MDENIVPAENTNNVVGISNGQVNNSLEGEGSSSTQPQENGFSSNSLPLNEMKKVEPDQSSSWQEGDTGGPFPYIFNGSIFQVQSRHEHNIVVKCLFCQNLYKGSLRSTGNFHMHIRRRHPGLVDFLNEMKIASITKKSSSLKCKRRSRPSTAVSSLVLQHHRPSTGIEAGGGQPSDGNCGPSKRDVYKCETESISSSSFSSSPPEPVNASVGYGNAGLITNLDAVKASLPEQFFNTIKGASLILKEQQPVVVAPGEPNDFENEVALDLSAKSIINVSSENSKNYETTTKSATDCPNRKDSFSTISNADDSGNLLPVLNSLTNIDKTLIIINQSIRAMTKTIQEGNQIASKRLTLEEINLKIQNPDFHFS